ncbi:MAG: DUF2273 domain-containing protein [Fusobacteriaceae bacterium]
MLEKLLEIFVSNRKKYLRCLIAFVLALLLFTLGFWKTFFIFVISFLGYLSGSEEFIRRLKDFINSINRR